MPPSPGRDGLGHARRYRPSPRNWDGTSELWPQSFGNTLADGCGNGCLPGETSRLSDEGRWASCKNQQFGRECHPENHAQGGILTTSHHISPLKIVSRGFLIENCWNSWGRCKLQHSPPGHFLVAKIQGLAVQKTQNVWSNIWQKLPSKWWILFVAEFPSEAGWNFWLPLVFFATDFPPDPAKFRPGFATPDGKAAPVPSKVEGWNAAWVEPRSKWGSHEPSTKLVT